MMMDNISVAVRMYRVGELGDCFLIRFKDGEQKSSVLIDCGSFRNKSESIEKMREIAKDITKEQGGIALDVVVGTHQHNDHLSGFKHAKETFTQLRAKQGWLSWLDDPQDEKAQSIASAEKKFTSTLENIQKALSETGNTAFSKNQITDHIEDILGFYLGAKGDPPAIPAEGLAALKEMSDELKYLQPGDQLDLPGLQPGKVKVYVLGPPRDTELLFDIHTGKGDSYDPKLKIVNETAESFLKALGNFSIKGSSDPDEDYFPFGKRLQKPVNEPSFVKSSYYNEKNKWQNIDTDWLDQAERLGLYLDSYTNNTSLVLAFELVESGKVLLFVGDAQTGNWMSWKDIKWEGQHEKFYLSLLERTVLYKVGHHCSHNATLVAGLERMNHPELVAMIPVDKEDPNITKKNGWKMPATNLHQRLKEKTQHRILRMEDTYDPDCDPDVDDNARASWAKLSGTVVHNALYIEYTIKT